MATTEQRTPGIQALLDHAAFVRALARSTLRGDADIDDVVQETWLTALRSPPADARSLKGWLATVVRRRAYDHARRQGRAAARVRRAAPPGEAASPEAILQREEARRRLVEAVLGLDEPYRVTLLLRYYHDLSVDAVAARLDVPRETVRTRLRRGLARLRVRLDPQGTRGRARLALGLAILAGDRFAPARHDEGVPAGPLGPVSSLLPVLVAAVGCIAAVAWIALVLVGDDEPTATESVREDAGIPAAPILATGPGRPVEEPDAPSPAPCPPPGWFLEGTLRAAGGAAVNNAALVVTDAGSASSPTVRGTVRGSDRLELDIAALFSQAPQDHVVTHLQVRVDHWEHLPLTTTVRVTRAMRLAGMASGGRARIPVALELQPVEAIARGRVERPAGYAASEVTVAAFALAADGVPARVPVDRTTADARGVFRLRLGGATAYDIVAHAQSFRGSLAPTARRVPATGADALVMPLSAGASISGCVHCDGVPAHARLRVRARTPSIAGEPRWRDRPDGLEWRDGRWRLGEAIAGCDEGGRYRLSGLEPLIYDVEIDDRVELHGTVRAVDVVEPLRKSRIAVRAPRVDVDFTYQAELLWVRFQAGGARMVQAHVGVGEGPYFIFTRTDGDGQIAWLREGNGQPHEHGFYSTSHGVTTIPLEPWTLAEATFEEHPKLTRLEIQLDGEGVETTEQFVLRAWRPGGDPLKTAMRLAPDARREGNRLVFSGVHPGRWRARLEVRSWYRADYEAPVVPAEFDLEIQPGVPAHVSVTLRAGGHLRIQDIIALQRAARLPPREQTGPIRVRHRSEDEALSFQGLRFRVRDADGREHRQHGESYSERSGAFGSSGHRSEQRFGGTGAWRFQPALPPGAYTFEMWRDEAPETVVARPFTIEAGKTTVLDAP